MIKPTEKTKQDYASRMNRVLEYIQTNLDRPISLDKLADIACFSPYHFHRIFSGMIGESLRSYIKRLRLERAAVTLKRSDERVTDIALNAGFATHESFTRAFNSMFGISPLAFRKTHQAFLEQKQTKFWKEITMKVNVIELQDMNVAFMRHLGPYDECKPAWDALTDWAKAKGLVTPQSKFLSLCHDDPKVTKTDKIRHDVCLIISKEQQVIAPISRKTIPGGTYAMTLHKGSYMDLADTYAQLCGQWAPQNGYEVAASASIQIYLNNYYTTPTEELLTEVYVPLN